MLRELINRFNRSLSERMVAPRRRHRSPVKVWFDPEGNSELAIARAEAACVYGETVDISRTGVGILVPSIRIKEKYLVGQERTLNIEIDLPTGKVYLRAVGRRYEKVGVHVSTERFLVGAHIVSLIGTDKQIYETFLTSSTRRTKNAAASLELGID